MLRYATFDLRCVLHMLCMYVATFPMLSWINGEVGRYASKTELKDMFQLSNDKRSLFDSKSTSINSLIIQHVYTLKISTAFMVETAPGLRMTH